jgi:hypothetical protein
MAHICRGKNIVQFGPSFITNLLQTGACLKNPRGFDRETCPLVGETITAPSSSLVFSSTRNMEQREIRAELWFI